MISDLYKELGMLTKEKDKWEKSIPYVSSLLNHESVKIQAKALWLLGEMGLAYPLSIKDSILAVNSFCSSTVPILRERAVNALGRIGRGNFRLIEPYWQDLFRFATDEEANVRLSFIWASENIATNTPDIYEYLRSCCTIRTTKSGWNRRKSSGFSAGAGRNSSGLIQSSCKQSQKQIRTGLSGFTALVR